jgi:hypothetical protein
MVTLIVSFGAGVDSTAMLVEFRNRGIRPDLILFADTGAEKPETYENVDRISAWCASVGFPAVVTVRYVPPRAPYRTLEGEGLHNQTLPGLAFGMKSCSLKWKVKPQQAYVRAWLKERNLWGRPWTNAIGLDASPADRRRKATYALKSAGTLPGCTFWYPLQEWGITRDRCKEIIRAAGLPVPPKSSCFFCPAMKREEIADLKITHPDLYDRAIALERNFLEGKHAGKGSTKGLGRTRAWKDL